MTPELTYSRRNQDDVRYYMPSPDQGADPNYQVECFGLSRRAVEKADSSPPRQRSSHSSEVLMRSKLNQYLHAP